MICRTTASTILAEYQVISIALFFDYLPNAHEFHYKKIYLTSIHPHHNFTQWVRIESGESVVHYRVMGIAE